MSDISSSPGTRRIRLRFTDLRRNFGRLRVLRGISGSVDERQLLLVTGANGSGKSTLLRCLAGLMAPQRGSIECRIDGETVDPAERRRAVGYVAPDIELYGELTTRENLDFFGRLRGVDPRRGPRLLDELGLPHDRAAGALSSGMTQRLRWALAVLHRPPMLLLDEPLQNLDATGRTDVLRLLERHLETGLAVAANPEPLETLHVTSRLDLGS